MYWRQYYIINKSFDDSNDIAIRVEDYKGGSVLLDGTDSSSSNAGDDLLQESATAGTTSNNLILDATDFNESDVRGDFLLDGTDADGTDAGDSLELEDELHEPKNKIFFIPSFHAP